MRHVHFKKKQKISLKEQTFIQNSRYFVTDNILNTFKFEQLTLEIV